MEEIIIDDIDVSKCELIYNDGRCFASQRQGVGYPYHKNDYCKYNSDCYYKQLKRKEKALQEIKEIAKERCKDYPNCACKKIYQKISEVE